MALPIIFLPIRVRPSAQIMEFIKATQQEYSCLIIDSASKKTTKTKLIYIYYQLGKQK